MEDLSRYFKVFSENGRRILESAFAESQKRKHYFISPEHILIALIKEESELFNSAMQKTSIDPQEVKIAVEKRLEITPDYIKEGFRLAPKTTEIFKYSIDKARSENRRTIETSDLCHILATWKLGLIEDILQNPEDAISVFNNFTYIE
jgi:ATP-dependent Clp protease ATP-binding subunit ClpA